MRGEGLDDSGLYILHACIIIIMQCHAIQCSLSVVYIVIIVIIIIMHVIA